MIPLYVLVCAFIIVTGEILVKTGVGKPSGRTIPRELLKIFTSPRVIIGFSFNLLAILFWLWILQIADLSYIYPMISMTYVLIVLSSKFFLKEDIPFSRWVSVGIICLGILLIAQS